MNERPEQPAAERREVIERREIVDGPAERPPRADPRPRGAPAATVWLWLIPLLAVVVFLVWFILSRGEPQNPLQNLEVDVTTPRVEPPPQQQAPRIEVPAPAAPDAPTTDPTPAPAPTTPTDP
jgi:hypothetical protein